jgi:hypothetical protein
MLGQFANRAGSRMEAAGHRLFRRAQTQQSMERSCVTGMGAARMNANKINTVETTKGKKRNCSCLTKKLGKSTAALQVLRPITAWHATAGKDKCLQEDPTPCGSSPADHHQMNKTGHAVLTSGIGDMNERAPPIARYRRIFTR